MASGSRAVPAAAGLSPRAVLAIVVVSTLAVRLIASGLAPLSEDEAYYRLWSLKPAFGYFDHPPMIAWWIWLGRHIVGDNALGVRLLPSLAAAATTLLTFDLALVAGQSERIASRAGVWLNATVLLGLGGQLAVPDEPCAFFWTAALCCAFRAVRGPNAWLRGAWWLGAGVAAGLACLSKYSALFLAPGVVLWLALTPQGRRTLLTPWPWLAAVIAAAIFAPNVAWNAAHHWLTFEKQFGRVRASGLNLGYVAKLIFDQFFLLNPAIAIFIGIAVRRRVAWPMLAIAAPFVAYLLVHSLHDAVQGQWPAPLYPMLMVAAAAAAEPATGWLARLRRDAAPVAFVIYAVIFAYLLAPVDGLLPFREPSASLRGWPAFFQSVEQARTGAGAAWVGAPTYGIAAQLASATAIHAPVEEIFERERATFETPVDRADFTKPGLVVVPTRGAGSQALQLCFAQVQPLAEIDRGQGKDATPYTIFRVAQPLRDVEQLGCYRAPGAKF